jgi:hypothetical protein
MRMKGKDGIARAAYVTATVIAWSWCMYSSRRPGKRRAVKSTPP